MSDHLLQSFLHHVHERPDAIALIGNRENGRGDTTTLSWRQLSTNVASLAESLEQGFRDNELLPRRIGYASNNTLDDVLLALATMAVAAIEVPLDERMGQPSIDRLWQTVDGWWLDQNQRRELVDRAMSRDVGNTEGLQKLAITSSRVLVDDPALILWTSGTTGDSKGVVLSHRNLSGNAAAKLQAVPQSADDVRLNMLPLSHAYARTCDFGTWLLSGCTLAISLGYEGWTRQSPSVCPTLANTVPSLARRLAESDVLGLDRLRILGCGGAAMSNDDFQCWRDRGVTVIQGYGLTEASPVICSATPEDARAGWVGKFVDGWQHRITGGQLHVRGPHTMLGYWNDPVATQARIDDQGWLDTGDEVEVDPETGQVRIIGRLDDVIVLPSGRKVNPLPIERSIERIVGVRHALLVAAGEYVDVWLDVETEIESLAAIAASIADGLLDRPRWQLPQSLHRFRPPLSQARGELTAKGTMRRQQILETRLSS